MRRGRGVLARRSVVATISSRLWGTILLLLLSGTVQSVIGGLTTTNAFVDNASLQRCLDNLHAADTNKNNELSPAEYIVFLDLESYGKINGTAFTNIPINLVLIYYFIACLCSQDGGGPNCCVGDSAEIDLIHRNGRPLYTQTFCTLVELGIYDALNPTQPPRRPSESPSVTPSLTPVSTASPTGSPTASSTKPTSAATKLPTTSPTQQPVSLAPTDAPTSIAPTVAPATISPPTPTPVTSAPTTFQTTKPPPPTLSPSKATSSPTGLPTSTPTGLPTPTPTGVPTPTPTRITTSPTVTPVVPPTPKPQTLAPTTMSPTASPTLTPITAQPTVHGLSCVTFEYGLSNQAGLDAYDIFNMVNNSLRTGLIIATRNITIEILNTTFPRKSSLGASTQSNTSQAIFQKFLLMLQPQKSGSFEPHPPKQRMRNNRRTLAKKGRFVQVALENAIADLYPTVNATHLLQTQIEGMYQRRAMLEDVSGDAYRHRQASSRLLVGSRRLVYYSDANNPITINYIFDNPVCPKNTTPPTLCAVVSTTVCVILEAGDNATFVDEKLLEGFQTAVDGGILQARIPANYTV